MYSFFFVTAQRSFHGSSRTRAYHTHICVIGLGVCINFIITPFRYIMVFFSWVCLGLMLANLARTQKVPNASLQIIITGAYIEAAVRSIFHI